MQKSVIYLDMDGVIVDFVGALLELHQRPDLLKRYYDGDFPKEWLFEGELGTEEELWWPVKLLGEEYWTTIKPFKWMNRIIEIIDNTGIEWYICTHAQNDPDSYSGKVKWLHEYLHHSFKNIIMTRHKHLLAHSNALLIDDNEENCLNFINAGGNAYLFPQPWNSNNKKRNRISGLFEALVDVYGKEVLNVSV